MLKLDKYLTLDVAAIRSPNLCDRFEKADLDRIGTWVLDGYKKDKQSRSKWESRTEAAMDLAMQIQKEKTFPWPNCSNIAFPLVTIAVLQFHSKAYSAIVQGTDLVRYRIVGADPQGTATAQGRKVGAHMSWQLLEQDQDWEEQHDRLIINLATIGTAFKKSYFATDKAHNESDFVMAKDLVLDYWAKSVETCPRKTHIVYLFRNDIYERVQRKVFRDILEEAWYKDAPAPTQTTQQANSDNRKGTNPPQQGDETTPFPFLEQHCQLDLDGDGYAEPYIITVDERNACCVRIVTRFDREEDVERSSDNSIINIKGLEYFTKYSFIPAVDGGIYDTGFGILLGPLNESVNSIINQMVDSGTMSNTAGGFLGRGAKIRGGVYSFQPFGWARVDSTGDDLRKNIFPLPVRDPSAVMFQLLGLIINYVDRVSGSTDIMVGENIGQNTPAETSRRLEAQGQKIYNSIFKRVWRSMKEEFRKLYILNGMYIPDNGISFGNAGEKITRQDYLNDPTKIVPSADPNITSDSARVQQALLLKQLAATTNGYRPDEIERRLLTAMNVEGIELIYPGVGDPKDGKVPPLPNPKLLVEQAKQQVKMAELQFEQAKFAAELAEEKQLNLANIELIKAQVVEIISTIGAEKAQQQLQRFEHVIEMLKSRNDLIGKHLDIVKKRMEIANVANEGRAERGTVESVANSSLHAATQGVREGAEGGAQGGVG